MGEKSYGKNQRYFGKIGGSMGFSVIADFVSGIFKPAVDLIDELHVSDEERMQAKAKLLQIEKDTINKAIDLEGKLVDAKKEIILAEANGVWYQRLWRPMLMYACITIIINNYIIAPYLQAIFDWSVVLDIPSQLWGLLTVGVGGFIMGRTGEKIVSKWKE